MNEIVPISPESLEIVQTYLKCGSIDDTANILGIHGTQVSQYLAKPEVKRYLDNIYLEAGYRNRDKIASALDTIIEKKLEELQEADLGSTKDIAELLMMAHKIRMDELKAMTDYEKAKSSSPKVQTNVQINETPFGSGNYGALLEKLLK